MTGIELIAQERARQIEQEGFSAEHDASHIRGELLWAAMYYAMPYTLRHQCECGASSFTTPDSFFDETGWDQQWAKRGEDRLHNLVRAGALIAAEIDRLQAAKSAGLWT